MVAGCYHRLRKSGKVKKQKLMNSNLSRNSPEAGILISVITVCRNADKTIETTLQSAAMQENVSGLVEHIVVDGASEDSTLEIVKRYSTVRWISESDDGISDAFNKGLHQQRAHT